MKEFSVNIKIPSKGLRPEANTPLNSGYLIDAYNVRCGPDGLEVPPTIIDPISFGGVPTWPYGQVFKVIGSNDITKLLYHTGDGTSRSLYSVDITYVPTLISATVPASRVSLADFEFLAVMAGGGRLKFRDSETMAWADLSSDRVVNCVCNFRSQLIAGIEYDYSHWALGSGYPTSIISMTVTAGSGIGTSTGCPTGGSSVTILGTGFTSGSSVSFGGTPATSVIVVNSTTITCVTPAHSAGVVNVTVTGVATVVFVSGFEYIGTTPIIAYTTQQMSVSGTQNLSASGGLGPYSWSIILGSGTLSKGQTASGENNLYTAPSSNANCSNNPTIKVIDSCGNYTTLKIAVNGYVTAGIAYRNYFCADYCDSCGTGNCTGCTHPPYDVCCAFKAKRNSFNCNSSQNGSTFTCGSCSLAAFVGSCAGCYAAISGCSSCTQAMQQGCSGHNPGETEDTRSGAMLSGGCCPATLL